MSKCGISKPTLYLARDSLRDLGYIAYDDSNRPTTYVVYEKIQYFSPERALVASAKVQYIPTINQTVLDKLRREPLTQELARIGGMKIDACKVEIQVLASVQHGSGLAISVHVETSDPL